MGYDLNVFLGKLGTLYSTFLASYMLVVTSFLMFFFLQLENDESLIPIASPF